MSDGTGASIIIHLIGWGEMNMHPAVSVRAKQKSIRNCSQLGLDGDKLLGFLLVNPNNFDANNGICILENLALICLFY